MSSPKYAPKSFAKVPADFGKRNEIPWNDADSLLDSDRLAASILQHRYAYKIRSRIAELGMSLATYSAQTAQTYDRNLKILGGNAVMRLDFVTEAERLLGHILNGGDGLAASSPGDHRTRQIPSGTPNVVRVVHGGSDCNAGIGHLG
ncbi:hypothetical protein ACQCSU_14670 [Pseudarthrobacter sp. O4]|uniref:hypothetical protein n=1 Tax=Pseudarthrobacter sp. O4 TaxID=3418417 RepID=UPI003CEE2A0A